MASYYNVNNITNFFNNFIKSYIFKDFAQMQMKNPDLNGKIIEDNYVKKGDYDASHRIFNGIPLTTNCAAGYNSLLN